MKTQFSFNNSRTTDKDSNWNQLQPRFDHTFFLKKEHILKFLMSSESGSKVIQIVGAYLVPIWQSTVRYFKHVNLYQYGCQKGISRLTPVPTHKISRQCS
jgi:hypothetical protein